MIGRLRGNLVWKQPPRLLIDVHGVGYEIEAPMSTFYQLPAVGGELILLTHLVVREDAHLLYGFASEVERSLFRNLLKVSGVGAKLALTILSGISVEGFEQCVRNKDIDALVRLPGIGKKTAERLIVEMRDRLEALPEGLAMPEQKPAAGMGGEAHPLKDALSALVSLGYSPQEASRMVQSLNAENLSSEEIIRRALQAAVK